MLRKLIEGGDVVEKAGEADARVQLLLLRPAGKDRVAGIFPTDQIRAGHGTSVDKSANLPAQD